MNTLIALTCTRQWPHITEMIEEWVNTRWLVNTDQWHALHQNHQSCTKNAHYGMADCAQRMIHPPTVLKEWSTHLGMLPALKHPRFPLCLHALLPLTHTHTHKFHNPLWQIGVSVAGRRSIQMIIRGTKVQVQVCYCINRIHHNDTFLSSTE